MPKYDLDKIKFTCDQQTFEKAVGLYDSKKVRYIINEFGLYRARVIGTQSYSVSVSKTHYDRGDCNCYLGKNDILCKHMVALAIYAVKNGKPLSNEEKNINNSPRCSNNLGELNESELAEVKSEITSLMRYIKAYTDPSKKWFQYQDSLLEGCNRLSALVSQLPVSEQTCEILVDLLIRLDKKLQIGGVDDSDGTVGSFIEETVQIIKDIIKLDARCLQPINKLKNISSCFGWEEQLIKLTDTN